MSQSVWRKCLVLFGIILLLNLITPAIFADEIVAVTAIVPANPSSFSATLTADTIGTTSQDTPVTYHLVYGSDTTTTITVQAQWTQGTIAGDASPSVDIVDYVSGSATNAYGGATPIIDPTNRTISWSIPNIPAHTTGQEVTFQLKTNSSYTGTPLVNYTVAGRVLGPGTQTPDSTVAQSYQYVTPPVGPMKTPTPQAFVPTGTPIVTPTPANPIQVAVPVLNTTGATVTVTTTNSSTATLHYGNSPTSLTQTITDSTRTTTHTFVFPTLIPGRIYYFQFTINENGNTNTSEIYSFTTPKTASTALVESHNTLLTSNGVILLNSATNPSQSLVVLPVDMPLLAHIQIKNPDNISEVTALFVTRGIVDEQIPLLPNGNGIFFGQFTTHHVPGYAQIMIQVKERNGSINRFFITNLISANRFLVTDTKNNPIEHAKVTVFVRTQTNSFFQVRANIYPTTNPLFTDPDGTLPLILPVGTYRLTITASGFTTQTTTWTISERTPTLHIRLQKASFSFFGILRSLGDTIKDFSLSVQSFLQTTAQSHRIFQLIALITVFLAVVLTLAAFATRIHLPILLLPLYLLHHARSLFSGKNHLHAVTGQVVSTRTADAVAGAHIYVADAKTHQAIGYGVTDRYGEFRISLATLPELYSIRIIRNNFKELKSIQPSQMTTTPLILSIEEHQNTSQSIERHLISFLSELAGTLFETILLLSLGSELLYAMTYSWALVLPFICLTLFSLYLWISHRQATR